MVLQYQTSVTESTANGRISLFAIIVLYVIFIWSVAGSSTNTVNIFHQIIGNSYLYFQHQDGCFEPLNCGHDTGMHVTFLLCIAIHNFCVSTCFILNMEFRIFLVRRLRLIFCKVRRNKVVPYSVRPSQSQQNSQSGQTVSQNPDVKDREHVKARTGVSGWSQW